MQKYPTIDYKFEDDHPIYNDPDIMAFHYPASNTIDIFLDKIENLAELYVTIEHEIFHSCFFDQDLDADVEHRMIDAIQWTNDDIFTPIE